MGEAPDIKELYETYGRIVYRRCQYFLRSEDDALDAMHDVFIKVVERYGDFRAESSPLTWLLRIATNHCLNVIRSHKAKWRDQYDQTVKVERDKQPNDYTRFERAELVRFLLSRLDESSQQAAIYYFVDEMTQEDAARAAGCSIPTFRKRLRQFIKVARKELHDIQPDLIFGEAPL
jgi:RNA polymerase sigma-70 factor (ECF subfamily)